MKSKGVTLTELLVVLALLGLIFIPSAIIFKKSLGAWWGGTTQIDIQQDARNAMYLLTKDIKGAMRCSIGAVNKNYSFEEPAGYSDVINNWAATDPDQARKSDDVVSGHWAMAFTVSGSEKDYWSDDFNLIVNPPNNNYILTYWMKPDDKTAKNQNTWVKVLDAGTLNMRGGPTLKGSEVKNAWNFVMISTESITLAPGSYYIKMRTTGNNSIAKYDAVSLALKKNVLIENGSAINSTGPFYLESNEDGIFYKFRYKIDLSDPTNAKLLREKNSGNWATDGLNPVCENLYTLTVTNINQQYFDVNLILKKETKDKKKHTYSMATRIYPTVP
ncbi:MAG: prepilin-type N-terminal cleavage/methylation domain-containing protein [Elusimicrobia bacterium]|nr:prepilin-type N-terminal cleavage/methylation domain-containing protein [Elusimicrobiota bacterium]